MGSSLDYLFCNKGDRVCSIDPLSISMTERTYLYFTLHRKHHNHHHHPPRHHRHHHHGIGDINLLRYCILVVLCLRWMYHHILSVGLYLSCENWTFPFTSMQSMMCAMIGYVMPQDYWHATPSHCHHFAALVEGFWHTIKCFSYVFCRVWV